MADSKLADLTADTAPTSDDLMYLVGDPAGTPVDRKVTVGNLAASAPFSGLYAPGPSTCEGRLTLTSGSPVTTSDVTAATSVYFTPHRGARVATYSGTAWSVSTFTEKTLSLSGLTADTNYDVFIVDGTLALESVAWTDATTRATALTTQDGVHVKSGATTRRYLGTFRTTASTGQTEDSVSKRYVWNCVNRTRRPMRVVDATNSWSNNSAGWRSANNSTANRVGFVLGLAEDPVQARAILTAAMGSGIAGSTGVGLDKTNGNDAQVLNEGRTVSWLSLHAEYEGFPSAGFHYLQWMECNRAGNITFYGDDGITNMQSGMMGGVFG